tara:strand:- start:463 stop:1206 length:744 start_codon:yes stop_codon:yes gene_type:complete
MNNHIKIDVKNREIFLKKPLLKKIYYKYFEEIKKNLNNEIQGDILEIGSSGFIKEIIPTCQTSNLEKNDSMIDLEENVYSLNVKRNSISNFVLIDIFHHLEYPKLALKNMYEALTANGRIIMIEPSMGLIPRLIYKIFHHEPNGFNLNIQWEKIPELIPNKNDYFAAQSIPWRAFIKKEINLDNKFQIKKVECFSDFAFLCSGGFSYKSFYPMKFLRFIQIIDNILTKISFKIFSARMIIILEKKNN